MTEYEQRYPIILDLFQSKPHTYTRLETRIKGDRATLFAIEESREPGQFTYIFPIMGGKIDGVRQVAYDLRADRPDVFYREVILKV